VPRASACSFSSCAGSRAWRPSDPSRSCRSRGVAALHFSPASTGPPSTRSTSALVRAPAWSRGFVSSMVAISSVPPHSRARPAFAWPPSFGRASVCRAAHPHGAPSTVRSRSLASPNVRRVCPRARVRSLPERTRRRQSTHSCPRANPIPRARPRRAQRQHPTGARIASIRGSS
jgi:hypothetical protein